MILIKDKSTVFTGYFPKHTQTSAETITMVLRNNITLEEKEMSLTDDDYLFDYYKFTIDFSSFEDGEYTYEIEGNSRGLLRIGEYKNDSEKYNKSVKYQQYHYE